MLEKLHDISDRLRGKHMKKLDSGAFRDAYKIISSEFGSKYKGCIVKMAQNSRAVEANRAEFHTWMAVSGTELEKYFCPILHRSEKFEFIIMERADVESTDHDTSRRLGQEIRSKTDLTTSPIRLQSRLDIKSSNVGIYNERPVMVDYPWGGNFEIRDN